MSSDAREIRSPIVKPTKSKSRVRNVNAARRDPLPKIRRDLDALVARMQTPERQAGVDALFAAEGKELGEIARAYAKGTPSPE